MKAFILIILVSITAVLNAQEIDSIAAYRAELIRIANEQLNADHSPDDIINNDTAEASIYHEKTLPLKKSSHVWMIEIIRSAKPLKANHLAFTDYGPLVIEQLADSKEYAYLLPRTFSNKRSMLKYIKELIRPEWPGARGAYYVDGKRFKTVF